MKTDNGYELSDFSVDIFEEGEHIKVRVECFRRRSYSRAFPLVQPGGN